MKIEDASRQVAQLYPALEAEFLSSKIFYASGSWTPYFGGTTTPGTYTYAMQKGRYVRLGPVVYVFGHIAITAIPVAATGLLLITNLPFTAVNTANQFGGTCFHDISNFNYSGTAKELTGLIQPNESFIRLLESFDAAGSASAVPAQLNTNCSLIFSGMYLVE